METLTQKSYVVFDISNMNHIFASQYLQQALAVAVGYNEYHCWKTKKDRFFVMNYEAVFKSIQETGGASYNIKTGQLNPTKGYMVALQGYEKLYDIPETLDQLKTIINNYLPAIIWKDMEKNPDLFVGFWVNADKIVVDFAENIKDHGKAFSTGIFRNQVAIYNCEAQEVIDIREPIIDSPLDTIEYGDYSF